MTQNEHCWHKLSDTKIGTTEVCCGCVPGFRITVYTTELTEKLRLYSEEHPIFNFEVVEENKTQSPEPVELRIISQQ